ncbi:V-set domain-containing T-cell activation inhibitor 1-like [Trachinotus anak]|uniref:V-set domain-containing T-cell activation inhibitor 1-like n=1 Tax=Trachinotus anak TaxID=443729 RepID=UPI0039F17E84
MTGIKCVAFLFLAFLWILTRGDVTDTQVPCVFMESCILPCSFQTGSDLVIHWKMAEDDVHSYYHNQDQLKHQDQHFRNRTSLFKDQISRGNASLLLTGVKVQDQGRYRCYTGSERGRTESFINLTVDASINSSSSEATIPCTASNISLTGFSLTWSFNHSQIILTQTRADDPPHSLRGVEAAGEGCVRVRQPHATALISIS